MLRSSRKILRLTPHLAPAFPSATSTALFSARASQSAPHSSKRPSIALQARVSPLALVARYTNSPYDKIDKQAEAEIAKKKLESNPAEVSTESSRRHLFEPAPANPERDTEVFEGLKHDVNIVKDTFDLSEVPREPFALGVAGTLPYLATSLSTMYLSWDLNLEWPSTSTFLNNIYMNQESAQYWLNLLEPIQLGYGAIIISFLGAVHWGMEYAEKTPHPRRTRFRYGMGVLAPMVAWPTLLMPVEYALTSQFAAFTFLYFADTRAKNKGWTPQWYGTYRFVLTAVVGLSIFISLVGRTKIGNAQPHIGQELAESMHKAKGDTSRDWDKLEQEERDRVKKEKKEEEKKAKTEEEEKKKKKGNKDGSQSDDKKQEQASDDSDSESEKDGSDENKKEEMQGADESGSDPKSKDGRKDESKDEGKEKQKDNSKDEKEKKE